MASIEEIASALRSIATPGMTPKALRTAIKEKYPDASKKEIVRAAFHAVAETSSDGQETLADLHNFALCERGGEDENVEMKARKRKKKRAGKHAAH